MPFGWLKCPTNTHKAFDIILSLISSNVAYCHVEHRKYSGYSPWMQLLFNVWWLFNDPKLSPSERQFSPSAQTKHLPEGRLAMRKTIFIEGGIILIIDDKNEDKKMFNKNVNYASLFLRSSISLVIIMGPQYLSPLTRATNDP